MTPPVDQLMKSGLLDACDEAGGTYRFSVPGRGDYELVRTGQDAETEEHLSESDIASLKQGIADFENGNYSDAFEFLSEIRREYGL